MPYTFSHPLAVVPFRRWCPTYLNFAALVIGSTSPDFGMFLERYDVHGFAHSIPGTFAVCLPTGLLVLGVFYLLRQPLCYVLPEPHRAALTPLAMAPPPLSIRGVVIATISILLGAFTHTLWDSFTHKYGWFVQRIAFLREPLIRIGYRDFVACSILQYLSSILGGAALVLLYFLWLHRQPRAANAKTPDSSDRWRYLSCAAVLFITFAIAMTAAYVQVSDLHGYEAARSFVFHTAVYSISVFFPLIVVVAIVAFTIHKRSGSRT